MIAVWNYHSCTVVIVDTNFKMNYHFNEWITLDCKQDLQKELFHKGCHPCRCVCICPRRCVLCVQWYGGGVVGYECGYIEQMLLSLSWATVTIFLNKVIQNVSVIRSIVIPTDIYAYISAVINVQFKQWFYPTAIAISITRDPKYYWNIVDQSISLRFMFVLLKGYSPCLWESSINGHSTVYVKTGIRNNIP